MVYAKAITQSSNRLYVYSLSQEVDKDSSLLCGLLDNHLRVEGVGETEIGVEIEVGFGKGMLLTKGGGILEGLNKLPPPKKKIFLEFRWKYSLLANVVLIYFVAPFAYPASAFLDRIEKIR